VPGGLSFQEASYLLGAVARSGRTIVGFDLVEVAPSPNGDEWDANVGARLLYKIIGWTLVSQGWRRGGPTLGRGPVPPAA
jgi:agmatinase